MRFVVLEFERHPSKRRVLSEMSPVYREGYRVRGQEKADVVAFLVR